VTHVFVEKKETLSDEVMAFLKQTVGQAKILTTRYITEYLCKKGNVETADFLLG